MSQVTHSILTAATSETLPLQTHAASSSGTT